MDFKLRNRSAERLEHARPLRPGDRDYPNYHGHRVALPPLTEEELWEAYAIPAPADVPPGLTESEERALWGDR